MPLRPGQSHRISVTAFLNHGFMNPGRNFWDKEPNPVLSMLLSRVTRVFDSFTLKLYAMDPVLREYEDLYHSVTDIDPGLTSNIANGLAIFVCARRSEVRGLLLDPRSMDSLCNGSFTRKLRFERW